jgi:hypothetical protein
MRRALLLLLVSLAACNRTARAPWPASGVYAGYYRVDYEVSEFVPSGGSESWWLDGAVSCPSGPTSSREGYIAVRGSLSAEGHYGHLGAYSRKLTAHEVLDCRELLPGERPDF